MGLGNAGFQPQYGNQQFDPFEVDVYLKRHPDVVTISALTLMPPWRDKALQNYRCFDTKAINIVQEGGQRSGSPKTHHEPPGSPITQEFVLQDT